MRVWSVISQKGGSGKTTLALHLAIAAAEELKVLGIDLEPQPYAARGYSIPQRQTGSKDDPSIAAGLYTKLPEMLRVARRLGADLVLIDTPPKLDKAITAALAPATLGIIPVKTSILDLQALEDCVRVVEFAKARPKMVVVMNAVPTGRGKDAAVKEVARYAERHELLVMPQRLSDLPVYAQGLKSGRGVTETDRNGTAAKEIGALLDALWAR